MLVRPFPTRAYSWSPSISNSASIHCQLARNEMEAAVEGLWGLADMHESKGEVGKVVKCLEAICQSEVSVLPILEVKTRLRIASTLLKYSNNTAHAKSHLERSQLLLKTIPSSFELKCRTYSLLSQCYRLLGAIPPQKHILNKGLELAESSGPSSAASLWFCNFISQLANAHVIEGDYVNSLSTLERGYKCASEACHVELQMFFATSVLHVHLMKWESLELVEKAVNKCNELWESMPQDKREQCFGLYIYSEFLSIFYLLQICDYKAAAQHTDKLNSIVKSDMQKSGKLVHNDMFEKDEMIISDKETEHGGNSGSSGDRELESLYFGNFSWGTAEKIVLGPSPINGLWLPKQAVYALVDLVVILIGRPKGSFKECMRRIHSCLHTFEGELSKLGITDSSEEVELAHSAIWAADIYLMLLMHFLENSILIDLTRSEFVTAQESLVKMIGWFSRYPTILKACECNIEILRGHYAHAVASFSQASYHFREASKLTGSGATHALCQVYAAVSYICIDDADSNPQALDLIGPVLNEMDSFVGVREKTCVLFAYGLLLMKQQNLQDARNRLATGLQITHNYLGNLQLVSQYLTVLGSLALALDDTTQARDILRSSFTLAKKLYDIPTQAWTLSLLTALYEKLGEKKHEAENSLYHKKKQGELRKRLSAVRGSPNHARVVDMNRVEVKRAKRVDVKQPPAELSVTAGLDIPESVGLTTTPSNAAHHSKRLSSARKAKRKI